MKFTKVSLCAATALAMMAIAGSAFAEDAKPAAAPAPAFTFNVGGATSYTFRGVKQTYDVNNGTAAEVFGGVDWSGGPNLYAGLWLSNTGRTDDNGVEIDYYGGWKPVVGAIRSSTPLRRTTISAVVPWTSRVKSTIHYSLPASAVPRAAW